MHLSPLSSSKKIVFKPASCGLFFVQRTGRVARNVDKHVWDGRSVIAGRQPKA
jgi:hypothetical protein